MPAKPIPGICGICGTKGQVRKNHEIFTCSSCGNVQAKINSCPEAVVREVIRMKGEQCVRGELSFKAMNLKRLQEENEALQSQDKILKEDLASERKHKKMVTENRDSTIEELRADNKALTEKLKGMPNPADQDLARTISSVKFILGMTTDITDDEMLQRLDAKMKDVEAQRELTVPNEESNQRLTTLRNIFISQLVDTRTCPLCDGKFIPNDKTVQDGLSVYRNVFAKTITIE